MIAIAKKNCQEEGRKRVERAEKITTIYLFIFRSSINVCNFESNRIFNETSIHLWPQKHIKMERM